jgi:uncharacterized protein YifE (UPF0438 family)
VIARFVGGLGLGLSVADFEHRIRTVIGATAVSPDAANATAEFSAAERAVLEEAGANFAPLAQDVADPVEQTRAAFVALVLDTLAADEVAARLGRDISRIRQRTRDRTLWAIVTEGAARYPRIQFADDGAEIPGMGRVVKALPPDLHPVAVLRWLTLPKDDLRIEGQAVSPRDWLHAGGHVDETVAIAEDMHIL